MSSIFHKNEIITKDHLIGGRVQWHRKYYKVSGGSLREVIPGKDLMGRTKYKIVRPRPSVLDRVKSKSVPREKVMMEVGGALGRMSIGRGVTRF